ncbi:eukaryotic translation initiation factor 2A [Lingula anatina]|uniref:Eukaryotic translation initiation factor 2A n=1 Tax=Lingula anatina TaxID=7574 RepID=A0A1S3HYU2_LINAN|nr:eukaryotic translation initiation factor 2A [Lingula anatina]|eukprot:XP_013391192.1 eukaryotic translation initiation factor 2A [Lingula anatina]
MAAPIPTFALRGTEGTCLVEGPPSYSTKATFKRCEGKACKVMAFSPDGSLFAWCNGESVEIVTTTDFKQVQKLDKPKTMGLEFSPSGSLLATWEPYAVNKNDPGMSSNLNIWDVKSGNLLRSLNQKKHGGWQPQWSDDEKICTRNVTNEVQCFENNNFDSITNKLHLQNLAEFQLASGPAPYHLAAYVPGSKGQPAFVRVYRYPEFSGPNAVLANKSVFKCDKAEMYWNKKGTSLLILTATETSAGSYYGDNSLHYIDVKGTSSMVPLGKNGPVYSLQWNPNSQEFCAVYGYMPAKATLYNLKCEPVFDFGTGPRNTVAYNAHGNIVCLAGFGNLRGNLEFWDTKQKKQIKQTEASDSTMFEWCPDGVHFLTATTAPRLRVGNGYKVWHYTGTLLHHYSVPKDSELWEAKWQSAPQGLYKEQPVTYRAVESTVVQPATKAAAYRPPGARGQAVSFKVHEEDELPSNAKQQANPENMSKAALKNKKKREAKAKAKEEQGSAGAAPSRPSTAPAPAAVSTGDPEKDKKIKNLTKKLQQIEKLKEDQKAGKQLEKNQLEKLNSETTLRKELEDLRLS